MGWKLRYFLPYVFQIDHIDTSAGQITHISNPDTEEHNLFVRHTGNNLN